MKKYYLSKSTFLRGVQCEKSLYLHRHHPGLRDEISEVQQAIFTRGTMIGLLARELFPGGEDASPEDYSRFFDSIKTTRSLIDGGVRIIYEAAFLHDNTTAAIDILVRTRGGWKGYEVKSSVSVSAVNLLDAAVQYYVITGSGIDLKDISIVHLNNEYVRRGELDMQKLFTRVSVRREVLGLQDYISGRIPGLLSVLRKRSVPDIPIGPHCRDPYGCDFMGHCWQHIPEHSVFDIAGLKWDKKFELYNNGIVAMNDLPDDYKISALQRVQIDALRSGRALIDRERVHAFLETLTYPLYFFDIETFNPAVPLYDNSRPYQQIPFQFSIHYKKSKRAPLKHYEYLAETGADPRPVFIEQFLRHTEPPGDILVYNISFEATRLRECAADFPRYERKLKNRIGRMKDLMVPFRSKAYYTPGMGGSHSIKYVMPELVPDLTYDGLEISDGGAAMNAYERLLSETDPELIARTRKALLEYCRLDTYGMVRILEELEKV
jgi:hypothetical protein